MRTQDFIELYNELTQSCTAENTHVRNSGSTHVFARILTSSFRPGRRYDGARVLTLGLSCYRSASSLFAVAASCPIGRAQKGRQHLFLKSKIDTRFSSPWCTAVSEPRIHRRKRPSLTRMARFSRRIVEERWAHWITGEHPGEDCGVCLGAALPCRTNLRSTIPRNWRPGCRAQ
jgi:hypothetical protein